MHGVQWTVRVIRRAAAVVGGVQGAGREGAQGAPNIGCGLLIGVSAAGRARSRVRAVRGEHAGVVLVL